MCRLVAMLSEEPVGKDGLYIFNLFLLLSERLSNTHGVGMVLSGEKGWSYMKFGDRAADVVFEEKWLAWLESQKAVEFKTLVGHTRLASMDWRNTGPYPSNHSHPFKAGLGWLAHNGLFKEHKRIAETLKMDLKDYTDSMAFAALLTSIIGENGNPSPETISEALKQSGEAEYAMLVGDDVGNVFAVTGERELWVARSNYGILVNTADTNIKDLPGATKPALTFFSKKELLKIEQVTKLEPWSIFHLSHNGYEKIMDISALKSVNISPITWTTGFSQAKHQAWREWENEDALVGRHQIQARNHGITTPPDWNEIVKCAATMKTLLLYAEENVMVEEINMMLRELYPEGERNYWWQYTGDELIGLHELLVWSEKNHPEECRVTESKIAWWGSILAVTGEMSVEGVYDAAKEFIPEFVVPFWHNTEEELYQLCQAVGVSLDNEELFLG